MDHCAFKNFLRAFLFSPVHLPLGVGGPSALALMVEGVERIRCNTMTKKEFISRLNHARRIYKAADPMGGVKEFVNSVKDDIAVIRERDPAAKSDVEVLLTYSGLHAMMAYRLAHKLYKKDHYLAARLLSQSARFATGIEIHPGATIGKGLFIDHGSGVVIGETAEIGDNCTIYQGVTLGGTGKHTGKRHPTLGDNVMVGAGAKVLGPFDVGSNTKIAAGAVVLAEIPDNSTAVGVPAKVVRINDQRVEDLDQVHIPDPVVQELNKLREQITELQTKITELEKR